MSNLARQFENVNKGCDTKFVFSLAQGRGYCADMIDLVKTSMTCMAMDIQFVLGENRRPQGYAVEFGWEDYFEPVFPTVKGRLLTYLNRAHFPLGRWPLLKKISGPTLRMFYGDCYFMCDHFPRFVDVEEIKSRMRVEGGYWSVVKQYVEALWIYREEVAKEINKYKTKLVMDDKDKYIALHIRRGDKIVGGRYSDLLNYVKIIRENNWEGLPVYVATDDERAFVELKELLGKRQHIFMMGEGKDGYRQDQFNKRKPSERWIETVFFMFELEMMKDAHAFIGAAPSNVYFWTRYRRGDQMVFDAG